MVNLLTVGSLLQKCHKNVLWLNILLKRSMLTSSDSLRTLPVVQPGFGGGAQGVWGTEVPQRGPAAEPLVGGLGGHSLPKAHSSY